MASEELARKLQSRLTTSQEAEPRPEPQQSPVRPKPQEADAACGDSSSELSAKLTRRQDINEGNAAPRLTRVFNPYTEFKEFSRKQIKDMETMFKQLASVRKVWLVSLMPGHYGEDGGAGLLSLGLSLGMRCQHALGLAGPNPGGGWVCVCVLCFVGTTLVKTASST
ncbi:hypothetical protein FQN60_005222 [Etheostoma spectabile]|uniref:EF-hand domain-containing protein n=1 Tax=Etheostoma spectabile TaxID=54343 RepID=A0A5J5DMG4_9PERO|nr:hypothetical protein FQN60_005222 [Etheostoma spectabile]